MEGSTARIARVTALVAPLILVNSVAIYGQVMWAQKHITNGLPHPLIAAVFFASALEMIGIYLAYEAHAALMAGDASGKLRTASYMVGILVGGLNYAHYSGKDLDPTAPAVAFGLLSMISPWLWSIRSRARNRDRLREMGMIDGRAAHFTAARWIHFPLRTLKAFRASVWAGDADPVRAIERAERKPEPVDNSSNLEEFPATEETVESASSQLPGVPHPIHLARMSDREIIEAAEETVRLAREQGIKITGWTIGQAYDRSERWGRDRLKAAA